MDATLTDEQERFGEALEEFLESEGGTELAREVMEGNGGVVDKVWSNLAEMDYTALTVPLDYRGLGEGMTSLAAVLEKAGRFAMPGPYPETMAFAVPLIAELGSDGQKDTLLGGVVDGDLRMSFGLYDNSKKPLPESIEMTAKTADDGYRLSGTKTLVPYANEVDRVIVAARTRAESDYRGVSLFIVDPNLGETTELDSLDRTRPMYEIEFDTVVSEDALLGTLHGGGDALQRATDRYNLALCAMLVGGSERAVERSVDHGNNRTQYGHPVGLYQSVKHRIVGMWIDMQNGRSLVYYAAWALDEADPDSGRAVSAAKSHCAEQLQRVFGDDIKNHGGMGFTWDNDNHIYLKQAKAWENFLGSPETHRERIANARGY